MSAFTVARTPVAVRVNARTQVSRRNVSVKAANDIYEGETAFWTSKSGAAMRGTAAEYEAAKESGDTYLASTVSGVLPSWAAAAGADSDKVYGIQNVIASPFQILEGSNFIASGPELMNGRAAMMGFVAAAGAEISTGETISQQFADSPFGVLLTFSLIIAGSLFSYTANVEAPAAGPFTKEKELLNGRAAMVGMGIMLAYETVKGSALL
jgi:hypothetical protein|tara:strand:- start:551 stop:1180 length:630 start_codon:yes stop_codon:yes gene_type:complete|mmetsp:Transcript_9296/g.25962  ORF Transcript_9296/g.25962 Transcript_9296/m.25962 type:complete len:210 (+) Transcript_9296:63-692(+)